MSMYNSSEYNQNIATGGNSVGGHLNNTQNNHHTNSMASPNTQNINSHMFHPTQSGMTLREKKEYEKEGRKQLGNFAAQAQSYLVKNGLSQKMENGYRTQDDMFNLSLMGGTTQAGSRQEGDEERSRYASMTKSVQDPDLFKLPNITECKQKGNTSPFKGFLDVSIVTQKLRKSIPSPDAHDAFVPGDKKKNMELFASMKKSMDQVSKPELLTAVKGTRFKETDKQVQMNPKVLETWINETLKDAEHLDIPGVILKPEHRDPISRYQIDRISLTKGGISNELCDRVYRALFVYSVGFYELIKKCLQHTKSRYTIITQIWKVFAILLEYCCRTDYQMLISEISKMHKDELDKLDSDYQNKFQEQANNERVLKENQDSLQKYCEELERERLNERQQRMKLQEDFDQNHKNHEEEVALRLKFESKLNQMHAQYRDLDSRYRRVLNDLTIQQKHNKINIEKLRDANDEITELKTNKAQNESQMAQDTEEINSIKGQFSIKNRQAKDLEQRVKRLTDDLDQARYKTQEAAKDNTELKLKIDVLTSTTQGLLSEKKHLTLELSETKELSAVFEKKVKGLMESLNSTATELQGNKIHMIGFEEVQRERENKVVSLKKELAQIKLAHDSLDLTHCTLSITHKKLDEQYSDLRRDHDDVVDKLHLMNKARYELETNCGDEKARNQNLLEVLNIKEDTLIRRQTDIEELDKKLIEKERDLESMNIKFEGLTKQNELTKKQLKEKIDNMQEIIQSEKDTRDMWIDRYEKEQQEHVKTQGELIKAKSDLKDQVLAVRNEEIKLSTANKQIQVLTEQNRKFQLQVNDSLAKAENLDRELNTQKEILKQMEATKKEYIDKLRTELEGIDLRNQAQLMENAMVGEDYRSRAANNLVIIIEQKELLKMTEDKLLTAETDLTRKDTELLVWISENERLSMGGEDIAGQMLIQQERELKTEQCLDEALTDKQSFADKIEKLETDITRLRMHKEVEDAQCQTILGESYFKREPSKAGSRGGMGSRQASNVSGSQMKQSNTLLNKAKEGSGSSQQRIGGGGSIRKPSNPSAVSNSRGSRGLEVDGLSQVSGQITSRNFAPDKSEPQFNRSNHSGFAVKRDTMRETGGLSEAGESGMKSVTNARSGLSGQLLLKEKSQNDSKKSKDPLPDALSSQRKQSTIKSKPSFAGTIMEGEEPMQTQQDMPQSSPTMRPAENDFTGQNSMQEEQEFIEEDMAGVHTEDGDGEMHNEVIHEETMEEEDRKTHGGSVLKTGQNSPAHPEHTSNTAFRESGANQFQNLPSTGQDYDSPTTNGGIIQVDIMKEGRPIAQVHDSSANIKDQSDSFRLEEPHTMQSRGQEEPHFDQEAYNRAQAEQQQQRLIQVQREEQQRQKELARLQEVRKVAGNTNIRKLIKSAATRD